MNVCVPLECRRPGAISLQHPTLSIARSSPKALRRRHFSKASRPDCLLRLSGNLDEAGEAVCQCLLVLVFCVLVEAAQGEELATPSTGPGCPHSSPTPS